MSLRRLLASTCVFACVTSPALPQTALPSAAMPSFATSLPELSMRETLQSWGLNRPTREFQFTKGAVSNTQAAFTTLVSLGEDGTRTTLENLVITRSNVPGATMGQYSVTADKLASSDGLRIGRITVSGLRGTANILSAMRAAAKTVDGSSSRNHLTSAAPTAYAQNVAIVDLSGTLQDTAGASTVNVQSVEFTGLSFGSEITSLDRVALKNMTIEAKEFSANVAGMEYSGTDAKLFPRFGMNTPLDLSALDLTTLALGHFSMSGLSYRFKSVGNKPPQVDTAVIGRISLDNIKDGYMGQFAISDIKLGGGVGSKAWEFGLERFNLGGVNLGYYQETFKAMGEALKTQMAKTDPATPPATPTAASLAPQGPPIMLKTLLKGGPLDGGMREFNIGGITFSAAGYNFTLDQMGMNQVRNRDDIVTRATFIPTRLRLTWPEPNGEMSNQMRGLLASLGGNSIELVVSAAATFAPETDQVRFENYIINLVGWGQVKLDFAISGIDAMMAQTSVSDFVNVTTMMPPTSPLTAPNAPNRSRTGEAGQRQQMSKIMAMFGGITFDSGRLAIEDKGGIDKAARLYLSTSRGRPQSNVPVTAQEVRASRDRWSTQLRQVSGDKSKPALMRQLSVNAARWLENGGSMIATSAPAAPIAISTLAGPDTLPPIVWGLSFANQPPALPVRR